MTTRSPLVSIPGICEVERLTVATPPAVERNFLIEIPHGATTREHYEAVRRQLRSPLPDSLEEFFFVNTDAGAPECAREIARLLAQEQGPAPFHELLILRCLIPRTFIDCNRVLDADVESLRRSQLNAAIPTYITERQDQELLVDLHRRYQTIATWAYADVCGAGGSALTLHTYSPRSVGIDVPDHEIVNALRQAYEPEVYARWPIRPDVEVLSETADGELLASPALVGALRERYARIGITLRENVTYRLHSQTVGYRHARSYPDRVLCVELNRGLLADPYVPFREAIVSQAGVARLAAPIAAAYRDVQGPDGTR